MTVPELFSREIVINAGGLRIASRDITQGRIKPILRVSFRVERNEQKDPNPAEVTIINLARESRRRLQEKGILTEIEAGYAGTTSLIFKGDLSYGNTVRQGSDWVTTLQATDSGKKYSGSRVNVAFDAGTSIADAMRTAADALGVGLGNLEQALAAGPSRESAVEYVKGLVMSGPAAQTLDKIARRGGWSWSVQAGQLQVTVPGQVINPDEVIVLNRGTGLVGSPEAGDDGALTARSLLQPELLPGKRVLLQAGRSGDTFEIDGFYRIGKTVMTGDTGSNDWYSDLEMRPI